MAALSAHRSFLSDILARQAERRSVIDPSYAFPTAPEVSESGPSRRPPTTTGTNTKLNVANYITAEETVRNDYCEWYGASGEWGSNYILGAEPDQICEEYPALKRLMKLKDELVDETSHSPLYLHLLEDTGGPALPTPRTIQNAVTTNRFDSILITPPQPLDWSYISSLPIRNISADPGFVFLWCGAASSEGLEKGRECFAKWGFRRAEDIVWVKTNKGKDFVKSGDGRDEGGLFAGQKEHCLMGIRGTVRRSTDSRFVHCNVDTDVMVWENEPESNVQYPPYLHTLIENFCLGTRRIHLFGTPETSKRGWVTAGLPPLISVENSVTQSIPFDPALYPSQVYKCDDGRPTLPYHPDIDNLRPKSPTRKPRNLPHSSNSFPGQSRGGMINRQQYPPRPNSQHQMSPMPGMSPGISPGLGMGMGMGGWGTGMYSGNGMMGMDGMGMDRQMSGHQASFAGQPGQGGVQFDPMVLAQAQAQAHAAIQAQMQMAMMQQMQAQMGMGRQQEMYGQPQMQQGMYGHQGQYGQMMGQGSNGGMGFGQGMNYGYGMGMDQDQGSGGMDWQGQGKGQGYNGGGGQR